jgi:putative DNA primase/helicase
LNEAHCRETAQTARLVGDHHESKIFCTWAPVAIAGIGYLPTTLEDRSIVIALRRRLSHERINHIDDKAKARLSELAPQAARWASDNLSRLRAHHSRVPDSLNDRAADNWRPLFAIAEIGGGEDWLRRAERAVLSQSKHMPEEQSPVEELLFDIREIISERAEEFISSIELKDRLLKREDRPWKTFNNGRDMTAHALASLLRPLNIRTHNARSRGGDSVLKSYRCKDFEDAFVRYLPPVIDGTGTPIPIPIEPSATTLQPNSNNGLGGAEIATSSATGTATSAAIHPAPKDKRQPIDLDALIHGRKERVNEGPSGDNPCKTQF